MIAYRLESDWQAAQDAATATRDRALIRLVAEYIETAAEFADTGHDDAADIYTREALRAALIYGARRYMVDSSA